MSLDPSVPSHNHNPRPPPNPLSTHTHYSHHIFFPPASILPKTLLVYNPLERRNRTRSAAGSRAGGNVLENKEKEPNGEESISFYRLDYTADAESYSLRDEGSLREDGRFGGRAGKKKLGDVRGKRSRDGGEAAERAALVGHEIGPDGADHDGAKDPDFIVNGTTAVMVDNQENVHPINPTLNHSTILLPLPISIPIPTPQTTSNILQTSTPVRPAGAILAPPSITGHLSNGITAEPWDTESAGARRFAHPPSPPQLPDHHRPHPHHHPEPLLHTGSKSDLTTLQPETPITALRPGKITPLQAQAQPQPRLRLGLQPPQHPQQPLRKQIINNTRMLARDTSGGDAGSKGVAGRCMAGEEGAGVGVGMGLSGGEEELPESVEDIPQPQMPRPCFTSATTGVVGMTDSVADTPLGIYTTQDPATKQKLRLLADSVADTPLAGQDLDTSVFVRREGEETPSRPQSQTHSQPHSRTQDLTLHPSQSFKPTHLSSSTNLTHLSGDHTSDLTASPASGSGGGASREKGGGIIHSTPLTVGGMISPPPFSIPSFFGTTDGVGAGNGAGGTDGDQSISGMRFMGDDTAGASAVAEGSVASGRNAFPPQRGGKNREKSKLGNLITRDESDIFGPTPSIFHQQNQQPHARSPHKHDEPNPSNTLALKLDHTTAATPQCHVDQAVPVDLPFSISSGEEESKKSADAGAPGVAAKDKSAAVTGSVGKGERERAEGEEMEVDEIGAGDEQGDFAAVPPSPPSPPNPIHNKKIRPSNPFKSAQTSAYIPPSRQYLDSHLLNTLLPNRSITRSDISYLTSSGIADFIPVKLGGKDPRKRMQRAREAGAEELVWEMKNGRSRSMGEALGDESNVYAGAIDAKGRGKRGVDESSRRDMSSRLAGTGRSELTWEPTPTHELKAKRRKVGNENDSRCEQSGRTGDEDDTQPAIPTASTNSDLFSQSMNPQGTGVDASASGNFSSESQSIGTFPTFPIIPTNSLTDLSTLQHPPADGQHSRVSVLAVVWEVGPTDRYSKRCELTVCQPTPPGTGDEEDWGRRKVLVKVVFWDECVEMVRGVKKGDVIWLKNLDYKGRSDKPPGYTGPPRIISSISSRKPSLPYATSLQILYRALPDRYISRGPISTCEECAAAILIRDVVRGEMRRAGENTDAVCERHLGKVVKEDEEYRPDRRLLEREIGMRKVRKLVDWVEHTFAPRA